MEDYQWSGRVVIPPIGRLHMRGPVARQNIVIRGAQLRLGRIKQIKGSLAEPETCLNKRLR
jgi:hypothetical protein